MKDPALLERLERIHGLLARSFVRYVVEVAHPWIRTEDPWDWRALSALETWNAETRASRASLEEVLAAEKVHPILPSWPLEYSQYHLVSPAYLLNPVARKMEPLLSTLEEEGRGLQAWPEEAQMVAGILKKERAQLADVRALEAERPKEPPKPAVKKGVSANFW